MGDDGGFNLRRLKGDVFNTFAQLEQQLQTRATQIQEERAELEEVQTQTHRRRNELAATLEDLRHEHAAAMRASAGLFSCCMKPSGK
mmetsp:Transcript_67150/g.187939  ORF Transcript_67150/g.187939 Transcript_67150/m.187939 type:complete len:87 (-) Transcript_67150:370-630(-)